MIGVSRCADQPDVRKWCSFDPLNVRILEFPADKIESGVGEEIDFHFVRLAADNRRRSAVRSHDCAVPLIRHMIVRRTVKDRERALLFLSFRHVDIVAADIEADCLRLCRSFQPDCRQRNREIGIPVVFAGNNAFPDSRQFCFVAVDSGMKLSVLGDCNLVINIFCRIGLDEEFKVVVLEKTAFDIPVRFPGRTGPAAETEIQIIVVIEHLRACCERLDGSFEGIDESRQSIRLLPDRFNPFAVAVERNLNRFPDLWQCLRRECRRQQKDSACDQHFFP